MKKFFAIIFFLIPFSSVFSQVVVVGHVFAEIVENLSVSEKKALNFGKFSISDAGGSISISPSGTLSTTGGVNVASGNFNPATFTVTGQKDAYFSITLPAGDIILTDGNSGRLTVTGWNVLEQRVKLNDGEQTIAIGATLLVSDTEVNPRGSYSGSYSVRFNYN